MELDFPNLSPKLINNIKKHGNSPFRLMLVVYYCQYSTAALSLTHSHSLFLSLSLTNLT